MPTTHYTVLNYNELYGNCFFVMYYYRKASPANHSSSLCSESLIPDTKVRILAIYVFNCDCLCENRPCLHLAPYNTKFWREKILANLKIISDSPKFSCPKFCSLKNNIQQNSVCSVKYVFVNSQRPYIRD